jgi:hypothetical protein
MRLEEGVIFLISIRDYVSNILIKILNKNKLLDMHRLIVIIYSIM